MESVTGGHAAQQVRHCESLGKSASIPDCSSGDLLDVQCAGWDSSQLLDLLSLKVPKQMSARACPSNVPLQFQQVTKLKVRFLLRLS